jgi:hypothetical protein
MSSRSARALTCAIVAAASLAGLTRQAAAQESVEPVPTSATTFDTAETVIQHDLTGPRLGVTFLPEGLVRSQFGWHFENQVRSATGPTFVVEKVILVGGIEDDAIFPSFTLVFGMRSRDGYEFGLGPSAGVGPGGFSTAIVLAAGQSFRFGGIRMPVNLAVALDKEGENRVSLVTGWAIRAKPVERSTFRDRYRIVE